MAERTVAGLLSGDGSYVENRPSKWDRTLGILAPYVTEPWNYMTDLMTTPTYYLMGGGTQDDQDALAGRSFNVAAAVTGGSSLVPKPENAVNMGIRAYHASPHNFDKFEWSAKTRGTGEGAQAYGDGLYLAENEDVALGYRDALAPGMADTALRKAGVGEAPLRSLRQFTQSAIDPEIALRDWLGWTKTKETPEIRSAFMQDWNARNPGHMYEVNIDAEPEHFLDWDRPLSEQGPKVHDALRSIGYTKAPFPYSGLHGPNSMISKDAGGEEIYRAIGKERGSSSVGASSALREAGIPGIKYLDAGSRVPSAMAKKELTDWQAQLLVAEKELADATAKGDRWLLGRKQAEVQRVRDGIARVSQEAEGTRNYVVFDDKLIEILRKYGLAGLLGSSAAYNAMSDQPQREY